MISYFEKQLQEIDQSIHSLKEEDFRQCVESGIKTLQAGHKIVVSGLGKNVPICEKFVGTMVSMGLDACFLHTNSAVHGDLGVVKDGDMVIVLTKSGETVESVYLLEQMKDRNVDTWALTFCENSTVERLTDHHLCLRLDHEGDLWNVVPNNSTTINLIVLQGLAMQIAKGLNVSRDVFKRNHPGGHIGETLAHT